ncbi:MAG: hypothetical protein ACK57V_22620 [Pirellula sp.]
MVHLNDLVVVSWWREMSLACTVALLSVVITITLIVVEIAIESIQFRLQRDWLQAGPAWASATLLLCCGLGLLASLLGLAIPHIAVSLGATLELEITSFVVQPLEPFGVCLVFLCGIVLAGAPPLHVMALSSCKEFLTQMLVQEESGL